MLTPDQLSSALYKASVAGFQLVTEDQEGWGHSYALCDGNVVLASGSTMEDAIEEWFKSEPVDAALILSK